MFPDILIYIILNFSTLDSSHRCCHSLTSPCITLMAMSSLISSFFVQGTVFVVIYTTILSWWRRMRAKQRDEGRSRWMLQVRSEHWARPFFYWDRTCQLPRWTRPLETSDVSSVNTFDVHICRSPPGGQRQSVQGIAKHMNESCWSPLSSSVDMLRAWQSPVWHSVASAAWLNVLFYDEN